jgi:hypothetical protein
MESAARDVTVQPGAVAAIFLRAVETQPGAVEGTLTLRHAGGIITAPVRFDIRPLAALRVHVRDENDRPVTARTTFTRTMGSRSRCRRARRRSKPRVGPSTVSHPNT